MAYEYQKEREWIFTDDGQRMFLEIRDRVHRLLNSAGAVRMQEATSGTSGDSWRQLACVDRMVELGEIREVPQQACAGQYRIFVSLRTR